MSAKSKWQESKDKMQQKDVALGWVGMGHNNASYYESRRRVNIKQVYQCVHQYIRLNDSLINFSRRHFSGYLSIRIGTSQRCQYAKYLVP